MADYGFDGFDAAFHGFAAWAETRGVDHKLLLRQVGSSSSPGSDPKAALVSIVELCDAAPSDDVLGVLTLWHIEALVDLNWSEIRADLEEAAASSSKFRAACAGAYFDDAVPNDLAWRLVGRRPPGVASEPD